MKITTIFELNLINVIGTKVEINEKSIGEVISYDPETGKALIKITEPAELSVQHSVGVSSRSRCCGRCDGHNDECVADQICDEHKVQGCETCFGKK